jgi:hypothetical protein
VPDSVTFHFAWVDDSETTFIAGTHAREDEQIFSLVIAQNEGEFATAEIVIENPGEGLLNPARKQYAWIGVTADAVTTALFFGRVTAFPRDVVGQQVTLEFTAQFPGWEAARDTLFQSLKVAPYWDTAFIPASELTNPDQALEARSALYHYDRVTGAIALSDIITGTATTAVSDHLQDSVQFDLAAAPATSATVTATVEWEQHIIGESEGPHFEIKKQFGGVREQLHRRQPAARLAVGRRHHRRPERLSGHILEDHADRPAAGIDARAVGHLQGRDQRGRADLCESVVRDLGQVARRPGQALVVRYGADGRLQLPPAALGDPDLHRRQRRPGLGVRRRRRRRQDRPPGRGRGRAGADSGALVELLPDRPRQGQLPVSARPRPGPARRVGARRRDHLRAAVLQRMLDVSCANAYTLTDASLPGGTATGKTKSYRLSVDGATGATAATITIAVSVGNGATYTAAGTAGTCAKLTALVAGAQALSGEQAPSPLSDMIYEPYDRQVPDDPPIIDRIANDQLVQSLTVANGPDAQQALLAANQFPVRDDAGAVLNENPTTIALTLRSLEPFDTLSHTITVDITQPWAAPKGIDLAA